MTKTPVDASNIDTWFFDNNLVCVLTTIIGSGDYVGQHLSKFIEYYHEVLTADLRKRDKRHDKLQEKLRPCKLP